MSVFEYTDYRTFLKDKYQELKQTQSCFSYRYFSQRCGYSSPNFLKLVIDGKRNLSNESVRRFVHFFKFSSQEKEYFGKLVALNQSKDSDEKMQVAQSILRSTIFKRLHPIVRDKFEYYSHWYYVAIRELFASDLAPLGAKKISELLVPKVSLEKVEQAINTLLRLGFIKKIDNRYIQMQELISTGNEIDSAAIVKHHREMLILASSAIDTFERHQRDISAVTVSLSASGRRELKAMIQKFRRDILELSERDINRDAVCQVGIQMFPLTCVKE